MTLQIYTDGACSQTRHGGWAWWVDDDHFAYGYAHPTTNQRMEVLAAYEALLTEGDREPVEIISDSAYLINCFRFEWYVRWMRKDLWRNANGKAVANRDIWEVLVPRVLEREHPVTWTHVRGHQGIEGNEAADKLAVKAKSLHATWAGRVR